jgi:hypothetical protein
MIIETGGEKVEAIIRNLKLNDRSHGLAIASVGVSVRTSLKHRIIVRAGVFIRAAHNDKY